MEVNGKVEFIGAITTNDAGTFSKRELVVVTEEQYPQSISVEFMQDKCDLLELYVIGDSVEVGINLRGRKWVNPAGETKYFNTIQGWKIKKTGTIPNPVAPIATPVAPVQKYVHIATDATYEAYKTAKWTDQQLVDNGKGRFEAATVTQPPAPAPAQQFKEEEHDDLPF